MYFCPASLAMRPIARHRISTGLNCFASCSYSATGIFARFMIHSPMPGICLPFHSPAGIAYRPQWMNIPKRASRNHFIRSWFVSAVLDAANRTIRQIVCNKNAAHEQSRIMISKTHESLSVSFAPGFDLRKLSPAIRRYRGANNSAKPTIPKQLRCFATADWGCLFTGALTAALGGVISHSLVGASPDFQDRFFRTAARLFRPLPLRPDRWARARQASRI